MIVYWHSPLYRTHNTAPRRGRQSSILLMLLLYKYAGANTLLACGKKKKNEYPSGNGGWVFLPYCSPVKLVFDVLVPEFRLKRIRARGAPVPSGPSIRCREGRTETGGKRELVDRDFLRLCQDFRRTTAEGRSPPQDAHFDRRAYWHARWLAGAG